MTALAIDPAKLVQAIRSMKGDTLKVGDYYIARVRTHGILSGDEGERVHYNVSHGPFRPEGGGIGKSRSESPEDVAEGICSHNRLTEGATMTYTSQQIEALAADEVARSLGRDQMRSDGVRY